MSKFNTIITAVLNEIRMVISINVQLSLYCIYTVFKKYRNPSIYFEWIKNLILYLQQSYCNIFIFCMWDEHVFPKIKTGAPFNFLKHLLCWHSKKGVFTRELMTLREYVPTISLPTWWSVNFTICLDLTGCHFGWGWHSHL